VGSGSGLVQIDNDIVSGRDIGQNSFEAVPNGELLDTEFDKTYADQLIARVQAYMESIGIPETEAWAEFSTADCVNTLMLNDGLFTTLARMFRMRKSLIQVPILWEMRHYNTDLTNPANDLYGDAGVIMYHTNALPDWASSFPVADLVIKRDSSTGLGQIFGTTAISSRNYCIQQDIVDGSIVDPDNDDQLYAVWKKLNQDNQYNISTVPLVHIWGAANINAPRPSLDYSLNDTLGVLITYQGSNEAAQQGGVLRLGLYQVLEEYNAFMRGA
jgi:hypothetical protein